MNKYPELENLVKIVKILDELEIPYYITGGFAVTTYGRPRFTADIDIVIKMANLAVNDFSQKVQDVFPQGYVDKDLIEHALKYKSEFNVIDPESGLKFDFFITNQSDFEKSAFSRLKTKNIDYDVKFISAEDLIISKLLWFRESQSTRQLEDIKSVIDTQSELDQKYINDWIEKLELNSEWQALRKIKD